MARPAAMLLCNLAMFVCFMYFYAPAMATSSSSFNPGSYSSNNLNTLVEICKVAEQVELLQWLVEGGRLNDFSSDKRVQLKAMNITGSQVKENICDWVTVIFNHNVTMIDGSCNNQELSAVCEQAQQYVQSHNVTMSS